MKVSYFIKNRRERVEGFRIILPILVLFNIGITVGVFLGHSAYWLLTWGVTGLIVLAYARDKKHLKSNSSFTLLT